MIKYFNKEEELKYEAIPTDIIGARSNDALIPNPTTQKETKMEMHNYFKDRKFILEILAPQQKEYFSLYYGLPDGKLKTLQEISDLKDVTKERARQLIIKTIRQLRHPSRSKLYTTLTDNEIAYNKNNNNHAIDEKYLNDIYFNKVNEIATKRFNKLSEQEKTANEILNHLLSTDIKEILKNLKTPNIEHYTKQLSKILRNTDIIYVQDILETPKYTLKENQLDELIDILQSIGLHFEEEAKYQEDFNKMCYASMQKVGLSKIYTICPIKYKRNFLNYPIEDLDLSVRTYNCLHHSNIKTVRDIIKLTEEDLLKIKNLGLNSVREIKYKMENFGISICPNSITPETWIKIIEQKFHFKNEKEEKIEDETKQTNILNIKIEDMDFSGRTYNCLRRGNKFSIKDIIMTPKENLFRIRNLGMKCYNEIVEKLKTYNLTLCPDDCVSPEEWIEEVSNKLNPKNTEEAKIAKPELPKQNLMQKLTQTKIDIKSHKKPDINEIPEEYRKTYAIGAYTIATEEMQKNLLSKIFNPISNKKTVDNFPKIKYTQKKVDALTDKQVLKIIEDDISLIDYLETSFIVNYKDELIKAILSNTNIDVEKRFEILQNISEAKISDLNQ